MLFPARHSTPSPQKRGSAMTLNNDQNNDGGDKKLDYTVGYGKPPKKAQWKRGQSGNPKGRAKGSKNFSTLIENALNETVFIPDQGEQKEVSKRELYAIQVVNKGIAGHQKFTPILHEEIRKLDARKDSTVSMN